MYDVVVVGGNLAGSTAGIYSAMAGAGTLVIEAREKPHLPSHCGEGLIDLIPQEFRELPWEGCLVNTINRVKLFFPGGRTHVIRARHHKGYIIDRHRFECNLQRRAERLGCELWTGERVKSVKREDGLYRVVTSGGREVRSLMVVGADGMNSIVGRCLGMVDGGYRLGDVGVCVQDARTGEFESDMVIVDVSVPNGYGWVFPKSAGLANVGVGVAGDRVRGLDGVLEGFISGHCHDSVGVSRFRACVPIARPPRLVELGGALLCGDAANVVVSTSGAGIGHALATGRMAGQYAAKKCMDVDSRYSYQEWFDFTLRGKLSRAYRIKERALGDPVYMQRVFRVLGFTLWLHKLCPWGVEKFALKNFRF